MSFIFGVFDTHKNTILEQKWRIFAEESYSRYDDKRFEYTGAPFIKIGFNLRYNTAYSKHECIDKMSIGTIKVAFKGRLDNRETLCQLLTLSNKIILADSEIIVHAYRKWGKRCVKYFNGDYLFVVFDENTSDLFACNSPFSCYSLLYYMYDGVFYFSSLLNPIKKIIPNFAINMDKYFDWASAQYQLRQETLYENVMHLELGSTLTVNSRGIKIDKYWTVDDLITSPIRYKKESDYFDHFREIFQAAVQDRLTTDFPLAAHLSGGFDSSSVVAVMAKLSKQSHNTVHAFNSLPRHTVKAVVPLNTTFSDEDKIYALQKMYPNIEINWIFQDENATSILDILTSMNPNLDRLPINIDNTPWIMDIQNAAQQKGARVVLNGFFGNLSLSWKGVPDLVSYQGVKRAVKQLLNTFLVKRETFLVSEELPFLKKESFDYSNKNVRNGAGTLFYSQKAVMFRLLQNALNELTATNQYISHITGVEMWDPTNDIRLLKFCLAIPNSVYYNGKENRRLVRVGMKSILPDIILNNTMRGHQNAYWLDDLIEHKTHLNRIIEKGQNQDQVKRHINIAHCKHIIATLSDGCINYSPKEAASVERSYRSQLLNTIASVILFSTSPQK